MVADYHRAAVLANGTQGARLRAVCHHDPIQFSAIATHFGVPCIAYTQALADPTIHAISICTPSGQHATQAIAAAQHGKHVLVEKPMALNLADADAMIAAAQQAGVCLGVCLQRRVEPLFAQVHAAIAAGDLGQLTLGAIHLPYYRTAAYYAQAAWRGTWALDGGGVLMNQGIHIVDQLIWNMGDPVAVQAYATTLHHPIAVEDTLVATLRFANHALATITATTTAAPGFPHTLGFYGTQGGIQLEGESVRSWRLANPEQASVQPLAVQTKVANAGMGSDPRGIPATSHIAIWQDFLAAIQEQRTPHVDGQEGRRSLATVLAIYEAAGVGSR